MYDGKALYEFLAFWCGGVTASELSRMLGIGREYAQTTVITPYKKAYPGLMERDLGSARTVFSGTADELKVSPYETLDALYLIKAISIATKTGDFDSPIDVPLIDTYSFLDAKQVSEGVFRHIIGGIVRKQVVEIDYLATKGLMTQRFCPHSLVRTSFRIHARGALLQDVSGRDVKFVDIVPSRVVNIRPQGTEDYVGSATDTDWHESVKVVAELEPSLPLSVRSALAHEMKLSETDLVCTVPRAISKYVKKDLEARTIASWDGPIMKVKILDGNDNIR